MDKIKAQRIASEIKSALSAVETKFNVVINVKGGRFDEASFTPRVEVLEVENGVPITRELASLRALHPELEGHEVVVGGAKFKVTGYRPSAPKFPFIITPVSGGKNRICTHDVIHSNGRHS